MGPAYAMQYLATGDQKWADLARISTELFVDEGKMSAVKSGLAETFFDTPQSYQDMALNLFSVAFTYDLCFEAWDPGFCSALVKKIANFSYRPDPELPALSIEQIATQLPTRVSHPDLMAKQDRATILAATAMTLQTIQGGYWF